MTTLDLAVAASTMANLSYDRGGRCSSLLQRGHQYSSAASIVHIVSDCIYSVLPKIKNHLPIVMAQQN